METNGHKKVIQQSDQFFCSWCGKTWDANDPHPPECSEESASPFTGYTGTVKGSGMRFPGMSQNLPRDIDHLEGGPRRPFPMHWPTPPQAYYLQRRGTGFVVWANGPKEAYNYAVRVGMRPTYMRRIDIPDRAYDVKTPRAEINPLTLELVRSRYPNFGEVVTPVQFVSRQKEKRK